jgi:hypothetical protein
VTAVATFSFGESRVLFSTIGTAPTDAGHRMYDASPDGSRFLMIRTTGVEDARVNPVVVDNFLAELRQKIGRR